MYYSTVNLCTAVERLTESLMGVEQVFSSKLMSYFSGCSFFLKVSPCACLNQMILQFTIYCIFSSAFISLLFQVLSLDSHKVVCKIPVHFIFLICFINKKYISAIRAENVAIWLISLTLLSCTDQT